MVEIKPTDNPGTVHEQREYAFKELCVFSHLGRMLRVVYPRLHRLLHSGTERSACDDFFR